MKSLDFKFINFNSKSKSKPKFPNATLEYFVTVIVNNARKKSDPRSYPLEVEGKIQEEKSQQQANN